MSKKLSSNLSLGAVFLGLSLFFTPSAKAQLTNYVWNNSSATWTNTSSWTPIWAGNNSSANSNNIAVFSNTANAFTTIDLSSNRTVGGIFFTTNAYSYTFNSANSKVLTIWDKGLTNNSGKTQTFNLAITIGGGDGNLFAGANSTNVFAGTMSLGSTATGRAPSFKGTGYTIVSGNITNPIGITNLASASVSIDTTAGAGVLFSGTNTYTGRTSIGTSGGILTVDRVSALSSASYLNFLGSSGTRTDLNLGGNGLSYTMNYFEAGGGGWINTTNAANTATLTFTNMAGLNAATGTTSRMLGVGTGVSVIFSGDYNIAGANTGKAMTFTVDGAGTTTFNGSFNGGANNNLTNGLIKSGSGVMNLNASNALSTTATAINGGTVNLGNNGALGTAAVSMNSNSTIGVTSGTRTTANNITMASGITGTFRADSAVDWTSSGNITDATGLATLNKTGTGTLSLSGANTYKDTTVTAGTLNARSAGALGVGTVTVSSGATLGVVGASIANAVKNSGTVSIGAGGTLAASTMAPTSGSQGALVLGGTVGNLAEFNSTVAAGTSSASSLLQLGDLTMNGNSVLNLQNIYTQINAATVTFAGTGNSIGLNGKSALWGANTYTLLSGTGMSGANSSLLLNLGAGNTVALGSSLLVGLKTYSFSQSGTTLTMGITSAGVASQVWDSSISSGAWNTTAQNWLTDGTGSPVAFNTGDNAALNSTATITVDAGGITASEVTLANNAATVTLAGGNLTGTTLSKSGGTLLMNNSANSFVGLTNSAGILTSTGTLTTTSGGVTASGGTVNLNGVNSISGGLLVSGGAVALGAASTLSSDSITVTSGSLEVGASANNGGLIISGGSITGAGTLTNTSVSATGGTIAANLAGTGGLTKTLAGTTLNLNNSGNSFTGGVAVSGGTLVAGTANNLAGQVVTVNGGTLDIGGVNNAATSVALSSGAITGTTGTLTTALTATVATGVTASVNAILAGSSGLTKNGSGTLALSGANTYTGTTTVNGGTLETVGNEVLANAGTVSLVNAGSTFKLGGNESVAALTGAATTSVNLQSYNLALGGGVASGVINTNTTTMTGTGSVTKNGAGVLYLNNGNNNYSGGFTLNSGEVAFTTSGTAGVGTVFGTGTLNLNGGTIRSSSSSTSGRSIYNNVALNGTVQFGDTFSALAPITVSTNTAGNATTLLGNSTISTYSYTEWQQNIGGNFRLTKDGSGTASNNFLSLRGSNNMAGVTVNSGLLGYKNRYALGTGTLILGDGATVGQDGSVNNTPSADGVADRTVANNLSILGNAVFGLGQATGGNSINYFSGGVDLNNGARTLTLGNSTTFSGVVSNGGLVVDNGTGSGSRYLALSGANTYAGGTTLLNNVYMNVYSDGALGAGSLTFSGTNASLRAANNITLANAIVLSNTATVDFINSATSMTLNGAITGAGGLLKTNSATLTLGGANTYAGTTTVDGGTLAVNGSLSSVGSVVVNANGLLGGSGGVGAITGAGTVGPGNSPGILTATSVNPTAGTDFKFEFTALNPTYSNATASGNDLLHLTAASPFAGGTFASGNIVSIYLNSATITDSLLAGTNTTFSGGFFVDGTYALASALTPASFAYYTTSASLGTGSAVDYNGTSYYLLDSTIAAKTTLFDTAVSSAGFATGTVSGTLLTFNAVPEPSTGSLMAFGLGGLVLTRLLRRKQS